jgi:hypothetical protein
VVVLVVLVIVLLVVMSPHPPSTLLRQGWLLLCTQFLFRGLEGPCEWIERTHPYH